MERGSGNPAWSNRTWTSGREWGPVERGRRGERERQKIPKPVALPHGGTVPPPLPARDQLPSCSQRKNPSRSCSSAGTGRSARAPPTQARHSAAPQASLPRHCTSKDSLAAGTGPAPAPAAGPRRPPPPSARFQIEIPWLGPSEDSARQPRPLAAEAPPAPPPDAPPARKPPRAVPRPPLSSHAPGAALPAGFAVAVAGYPELERCVWRPELPWLVTANARVQGFFTRYIPPLNPVYQLFKSYFFKVHSLTNPLLNTYSVADTRLDPGNTEIRKVRPPQLRLLEVLSQRGY